MDKQMTNRVYYTYITIMQTAAVTFTNRTYIPTHLYLCSTAHGQLTFSIRHENAKSPYYYHHAVENDN